MNLTELFKTGLQIDHKDRLSKINLTREELSSFLTKKKIILFESLLESLKNIEQSIFDQKLDNDSFITLQKFLSVLEKRPNYRDFTTEMDSIDLIKSKIERNRNKLLANDSILFDVKNKVLIIYKELDFIFNIDPIVLSIKEKVFIEELLASKNISLDSYNESMELIRSQEYLKEIYDGRSKK